MYMAREFQGKKKTKIQSLWKQQFLELINRNLFSEIQDSPNVFSMIICPSFV